MTNARSLLLSALLLPAVLFLGEPDARAEDEPQAESRMWLRLKRMDTDGDGRVSRDEFQGPDRLWDRLDGDGDGSVSRAEADKMASGGRGGKRRGGQRGGGGARGGRGAGLTLEKLDTNKDGSISKAEWDTFLKEADENEDQILQKEEWAAAVGGGAMQDPAPKVGSRAPKVQAQVRGLKAKIDLAAPKRTTVLIFGSWT